MTHWKHSKSLDSLNEWKHSRLQMSQRLIHGTLYKLGEFYVFEIVPQHKQSAGQQKCPLSLSSLPRMSVQGKESFFLCCPPHCSLFIVKEVEVGHCSVYCKLCKMCHNKNSEPRKKTGSHLKDCRLKMAKCSRPQKEGLGLHPAGTSDQNAQNASWQLEPGNPAIFLDTQLKLNQDLEAGLHLLFERTT